MKNDGKDAEKAFVAYWERRGHLQRLRDARDLMGINGGARVADFAKPCDFLVSSKTDPLHYAEVKSTNHATRFEFKSIRPAQRAAALLEAKRGQGAFHFYIFSYSTSKWYIMSCHEFADCVSADMKSILFEELTLWEK